MTNINLNLRKERMLKLQLNEEQHTTLCSVRRQLVWWYIIIMRSCRKCLPITVSFFCCVCSPQLLHWLLCCPALLGRDWARCSSVLIMVLGTTHLSIIFCIRPCPPRLNWGSTMVFNKKRNADNKFWSLAISQSSAQYWQSEATM